MKVKSAIRGCGGFTMVEILIGATLLTGVGIACYSMLLSSTVLFAKNVSLNSSGAVLRTALDRMYNDINHGYGMPKLINVDGSPATTTSAAGITFDLFLGGPYVVTNPGTTGLPASATGLTMKHYASDTLTAQPLPVANDVVVLDNGLTRPVVNTCTSSISSNVRTLTIIFKSTLGSAVSWSSNTTKTASLVHKKTYIVAPANGDAELRMYNNPEAVTDYSDPANYIVLSRGLSDKTTVDQSGQTVNDKTPFSIVDENGSPCVGCSNPFLQIAMRVEDQGFDNTLKLKQANEFNTFLRLETRLRPRN
jgi:hypothetical protein